MNEWMMTFNYVAQNYEDSSMVEEGEMVEVRSNQIFLESMLAAFKSLLDHNIKVSSST